MKKKSLLFFACICVALLAAGCNSAANDAPGGANTSAASSQTSLTGDASSAGTDSSTEAAKAKTSDGKTVVSGDTAARSADEVVAYVGQDLFDGNYDPLASDVFSRGYKLFHSGLLKIGMDANLEPDLATDYKVSDDGLTYTFHLRQAAKFSDGTPVTAEDVAFTYKKAKELVSPGVDMTRLEDAKAVDESTVQFTLNQHSSNFLVTTAQLGIVPEHAYGKDYAATGMGSGPWKFVQLDVGQQLIVEPNPYYYGKKPSLKKVTFMKLDNDAALAAAKSGQLDIVMVNPEYALDHVDGMHLVKMKTMDIRNINLPVIPETKKDGMTIGNNFTCDKNVRKAMAIGIDRQKVIDQALNGIGKPAFGLSTELPWANTKPYADGRVEEAKALLESSGWKMGKDKIREKNGVPAEFTVDTASNEMDRYNVVMAVSEQLRALGIKMTVHTVTWDDIEKDGHSNGVLWGWGSYNPDLVYSLYSEHALDPATSPYSNNADYINPKTDAYISQALAATTDKQANEFWRKAQDDGGQGPNDDYPYLFIVNIEHCYFVRDGLNIHPETQPPHPHGHGMPIIFNMNQWEWNQ